MPALSEIGGSGSSTGGVTPTHDSGGAATPTPGGGNGGYPVTSPYEPDQEYPSPHPQYMETHSPEFYSPASVTQETKYQPNPPPPQQTAPPPYIKYSRSGKSRDMSLFLMSLF